LNNYLLIIFIIYLFIYDIILFIYDIILFICFISYLGIYINLIYYSNFIN